MTAFEVTVNTALDEMHIELVENASLPEVIDPRNPYHFQIDHRDGIWYCEGLFRCRENPDGYVSVSRAYSDETVAALSTFYEDSDDFADVFDDGTLQCLRVVGGGTKS